MPDRSFPEPTSYPLALHRQDSEETKVKSSMGEQIINGKEACTGGEFDPLKSKPN